MQTHLKNEIHNVISGKSPVSYGTIIQTIASYLNDGSQSSTETENSKQVRAQETKRLEIFISDQNLWIADIDLSFNSPRLKRGLARFAFENAVKPLTRDI